MDFDIINLTDEGYLMSPEYNNLSNFTVDDLEELSEIIRQAEAEETKHSAPAPIPSTADVVKRADPVQPSSQTAPEHTKDATRPPVQTLHSSAPGRKRWQTPSSDSSNSDGRPSVSRNGRKTTKRPRKCTHSFKCTTCQRERQEIHLLQKDPENVCVTCQREKEENTSSRRVPTQLRGDTLPQGASCVVSGEEFDLTHLQSFLDRIVQSNTAVKTNGNLVFTVQLVKNPRGGGQRLLSNTLDGEIIKKKRRSLRVIINGHDNQLQLQLQLHTAFTRRDKTYREIDFLRFREVRRLVGSACPFSGVRPVYRKSVFIAHNARGFDRYVVLNAMLSLNLKPKALIMQGSKVVRFTDPDYEHRYIDSLSFLTCRLSALPKALGFPDKNKGFFPNRFSSENHLKYVGPYPEPEAYGVKQMSREGKREFEAWYETVRHGTFNFEKEAVRYCQNDVDILVRACDIFRKGYINEKGMDPFSCATITSACMKVFRTNFRTSRHPGHSFSRRLSKTLQNLLKRRRSVVRVGGAYRGRLYLACVERGRKTDHRYFVDRYAKVRGVKTAWEFLGCFYHGCPSCFQSHDICPLTGRPIDELHASTVARIQTLESVHGLKVNVMREHD
ncbi:hypothetical protein ABVT39_015396 [Epinephelus coioides]